MPESVLKAALLRRATEDINRVLALRSQKQALAMLLQRGSVGDDLWQRFIRAEKEMEDEVRDVVSEVSPFCVFGGVHRDANCGGKGKRIRTKLGPNNLSIRQRNDE